MPDIVLKAIKDKYMNKMDKQFEELMKSVRIDAPSPHFTSRVMSRIQTEAAVQPKKLLQDYQPVISRKTWFILGFLFLAFLIYVTATGNDSAKSTGTGVLGSFMQKLAALNSSPKSFLATFFGSIPVIAYVIALASVALWTLDSYLTRFRHQTLQVNQK
jgi:hypothetical protein